jgi:hypothetical protein
VNVALNQNPKQELFFNTAINAALGKSDYRYLFYGGAIRGGKSFVCATIFLFFAKMFKNSRWHIFRSDFPALSATTIPTFEKIITNSPHWRWNRDKSNYYLENTISKGKIFFRGENITQDPELNDLLGLETNGIWLEQIEELSEKLFEIGLSRCGSWYIDNMPMPIILSTFNPTQTWVKQKVFEPFRLGELKPPYYFLQALPSDNAFVTKEQWQGWGMMAERYQKQFIEGDWSDFTDKNNLWAFAFESNKHLAKPELKSNEILYLSFDFNKNPITCSVIQWYEETVKVLDCIKLENSDIYALCDYILVHYPQMLYMITGDATGQNTSALVKDNLNYYTVIKSKLMVSNNQLMIPSVNPRLEDNQVLVNSILANYKVEIHDVKAKNLVYDLMNVRTTPNGGIEKSNRQDKTQQADALDTFRYFCNTYLQNFLKFM